jgi:hypothetical protein
MNITREIYADELPNGFRLTAYTKHEDVSYFDHVYEGEHFETLLEDFVIDNPEYKGVSVSWN